MAIYHLSVKLIGRSAGRSATGAAAYRAGIRIVDARTGRVFDYSRRKNVAWKAIAAPQHAPDWAWDREKLWNIAEQTEIRRDSQLCREVELSLPRELSLSRQQRLVAEFVENEFTTLGMVADIAIHNNPGNPHCHLLLSLRELLPNGFGLKVREWNDKGMLERWRVSWEIHCNKQLEAIGSTQRINHQSLIKQGLRNLVPKKRISIKEIKRINRSLQKKRAGNENGLRLDRNDESENCQPRFAKFLASLKAAESQIPAPCVEPLSKIQRAMLGRKP